MTMTKRGRHDGAAEGAGRDAGTVMPPAWLTEEQRAEYKQLAKLVPGFHPVLDQMALAAYVQCLSLLRQARDGIARASSDEERRLYEELAQQQEASAREWAETLGLTPASRLEITRAIRSQQGLWAKLRDVGDAHGGAGKEPEHDPAG